MKRICTMILAIIMIFTMLPISVFASNNDNSNTISDFTVIDKDKSTLAPGVTLEEMVLYNSKNQRVEMYVTTVDTTVDTVQVKANYLNNQNAVYGMQTLSEQVAAMEKNYAEPFKIVAGINASYYNTTTGKPYGAFVMEGIDVTTESEGNNYAFFAVLKDGTYMIGAKGEYSSYKGQIQEAIGGYIHIVKDGAVVSGLDKTTLYPRQTLGLTAEGKLILMTADGSQAPTTVGTTVHEQAEIMKALGCVEAIHLDGGNSATFGVIPEGSDKFVTKNSPSGGAERAVSNTLMIISTAIPDGTFDHAVITSEYDYFAPYSKYTFSSFGVDATNASAEIPETAVWVLSDDSFGTISNGTFVSNGKEGTVAIQMRDNGNVIGSKNITIVDPSSASFALEETTVPFGKTVILEVTALYGNYSIYTDASHYSFVVDSSAAGTMNGFEFTATNDESFSNARITATYKYGNSDVKDTITAKFGKGSEILFDFEDGDISDWKGTEEYKEWREEYNKQPDAPYQLYDPDDYSNGIDKQTSSVFLATKENGGKVKNGEYALGFRMNHLQLTDVAGWIYNYLYYTGETKVLRDVANGQTAIRLGMWVYSPDITNVAFRLVRGIDTNGKIGIKYSYMTSDYDGIKTSYATNYAIPEAGWIYVYYDLTDVTDNIVQSTSIAGATLNGTNANADYFPAFLQLFTGSATDTMNDMIFYIDDITLDYSDVTEDRDAPAISDASICFDTANFVLLDGQITANNNLLSFSAKVTDVSGNSNMTGIDYTTAKIYIDGIDMSDKGGFKATNGYISLTDVYLTNGKHSIAFVVFDNQGNETRVTKMFTVSGNADNSVISLVGRNDGQNVPKAGSVYYIDIKASAAEKIDELVTTLKLNTANKFEYRNIVCAEGVSVTAEYDALNFEVTITLKNNSGLSGEAVLASVPIRVWAWDEVYTGISADEQFNTKAIPVIDIELKSLYGKVTYVNNNYNNYVCGFSEILDVSTELDNKTVWHKHSTVAMDDFDATCTKNGYTDRTYCQGCASVIDWGTFIEAKGHSYSVVEGKLACDCGEQYSKSGLVSLNGSVYYILGGSLSSGWNYVSTEDDETTGYYYFSTDDYAAVNGEQMIDGYSYKFENRMLVRGNLINTDGIIKYMWAGSWTKNSWMTIDDQKYYFANDGVAMVGPSTVRGFSGTYAFDANGVWLEGRVGLLEHAGKVYYYENGMCKSAGLVKIGDDFYYIGANYHPVTGMYWVGKPNTAVTGMTEGEYEFGTDGKMIRKIVKNGIVGDYLYINDVMQKAYQLILFEDHYYFINEGNKIAKNTTIYLKEQFTADYGLKVGYYDFDGDGKMIIKNGPVGDYFYLNNVMEKAYQLVSFEGNYYFINVGNKLAKNTQVYLTEKFTSQYGLAVGYYDFDADGKLVIKNGVEGDYFYLDGVMQKAYQLIEFEGDYYFINDGNKVSKNMKVYLTERFTEEYGLNVGYYDFDADGKLVIKNGVEGDYFYLNGVMQKAYQLIKFEGDYYFINDGNKIAKNTSIYLTERFTSEYDMTVGYYDFDEDGKMIMRNGVEGDYFYLNGALQKAYQLIYFEGNYYFVNDANKIAKNTTIYLTEKFTAQYNLNVGKYDFDENGKMIIKNGAVGDYFYVNNVLQKAYQLVKWEDNYYFINIGNKIAKDTTIYLTEQFTAQYSLAAGYYDFDTDGKMIIKNGVIGDYFYIDNILQKAYQLVEWEGNYYFINDGNKIAKNKTIYLLDSFVSKYGLAAGKYFFDAEGKMILKNGPVDGKLYINGVLQKAYQLVEFEGNYYFVNDGNFIAKDCTIYLSNEFAYVAGLTAGYYNFDSNGILIFK